MDPIPVQGVNRAPLLFVHGSSKAEEVNPLGQRSRLNGPTFRLSSPFKSLKIVFARMPCWELWTSAIYYTVYDCVQASMASLFVDIYRVSELEMGISYLAIWSRYGSWRIPPMTNF
jgi:hypothetical protein